MKRKTIPASVKMKVLAAQARCASCGERLGSIESIEYDHRPPLFVREMNRDGTDTVPAQNNPLYLQAVHKSCHLWRTAGRKPGAARTATSVGSDIHVAAKIKRMTKPPKKKWTRKIRSRGFPKVHKPFKGGKWSKRK